MKVTVLLAALAVSLCLTAAAQARCTQLPAPSGTSVHVRAQGNPYGRVRRFTLAVCTGGRTVVVARSRGGRLFMGTEIGAASAACRHIAWITQTSHAGARAFVVNVATVSARGRVHLLRHDTVERAGTSRKLALGIALTVRGELAWTYSSDPHPGPVVLLRRGGRPRVVAHTSVGGLHVEGGRTLRWDALGGFGWHDLSPRTCARAGYTTLIADDVVAITHRHHGDLGEGTWVLRACDLTTHRDRVISQHAEAFPDTDVVHVAALQGSQVVLVNVRAYRYDGCCPDRVRTVDALTGRSTPWTAVARSAVPAG